MLIMFTCHSWADSYDPLLLRAQSSIFPKITLLDKKLTSKTNDNVVELIIVSTKRDFNIAQQLQGLIKEKYGNRLGNKELTVNIVTFGNFNHDSLATSYILLQGTELEFKKVISYASSNHRIVFSYSYTDLKNNSLISLYVKEKTYIYLNKSAIQLYDIKFLPVFYKLTKIIE